MGKSLKLGVHVLPVAMTPYAIGIDAPYVAERAFESSDCAWIVASALNHDSRIS